MRGDGGCATLRVRDIDEIVRATEHVLRGRRTLHGGPDGKLAHTGYDELKALERSVWDERSDAKSINS